MIEQGLFTHLSNLEPLVALVGSNIYPGIAPQDVSAPYLVFVSVSDNEYYDLGGDIGLSEARIQIECWADSYISSKELSEVVRMHISGFAGYFGNVKIQRCVRSSVFDRIDNDAEEQGNARYCAVCDYEIVYEKERAYL